jgi:hypothetical protein
MIMKTIATALLALSMLAGIASAQEPGTPNYPQNDPGQSSRY